MADAAAGEAAGKETVEGTIKSVVFHNDENGYTVLHVELPSDFELARPPEITVVGRAQGIQVMLVLHLTGGDLLLKARYAMRHRVYG